MKQLLFAMIVFFGTVSPVWAGCDLQNTSLPSDVRKQIEADCAKAELALEASPKTEVISAYADVAIQVAKAIGIAAKEAGIAVNEFIVTPAGQLTVAIILIKVLGGIFFALVAAFCINVIGYKVLKALWYEDTGNTVVRTGIMSIFGYSKVYTRLTFRQADSELVTISAAVIIVCVGSLIALPLIAK